MLKYDSFRLTIKYEITVQTPKLLRKKNILPGIRTSGKSINFGYKKNRKSNFYKNKKVFKIDNIDYINYKKLLSYKLYKLLVSKKESYGTNESFKYFIGCDDDNVVRPLCTKLSQVIGYVKCFESKKTISFKINDNRLLRKYTKMWKNVKNLLNIKFDCEPIHGDNDKYIMTKIKIYGDNVNTNFQGNNVPKENASYKCLSLIMLDSIIKAKKSIILK